MYVTSQTKTVKLVVRGGLLQMRSPLRAISWVYIGRRLLIGLAFACAGFVTHHRVYAAILRVRNEMEPSVLETRWIILFSDGRHVTIGRNTDPTAVEITKLEDDLVEKGLSGWLAVMKGCYYTSQSPSLLNVRALAHPACSFGDAVREFEAKRTVNLSLQ